MTSKEKISLDKVKAFYEGSQEKDASQKEALLNITSFAQELFTNSLYKPILQKIDKIKQQDSAPLAKSKQLLLEQMEYLFAKCKVQNQQSDNIADNAIKYYEQIEYTTYPIDHQYQKLVFIVEALLRSQKNLGFVTAHANIRRELRAYPLPDGLPRLMRLNRSLFHQRHFLPIPTVTSFVIDVHINIEINEVHVDTLKISPYYDDYIREDEEYRNVEADAIWAHLDKLKSIYDGSPNNPQRIGRKKNKTLPKNLIELWMRSLEADIAAVRTEKSEKDSLAGLSIPDLQYSLKKIFFYVQNQLIDSVKQSFHAKKGLEINCTSTQCKFTKKQIISWVRGKTSSILKQLFKSAHSKISLLDLRDQLYPEKKGKKLDRDNGANNLYALIYHINRSIRSRLKKENCKFSKTLKLISVEKRQVIGNASWLSHLRK